MTEGRILSARRAALTGLCASSICLGGFAPPPPRLGYELAGLLDQSSLSFGPVEPGEQYPAAAETRLATPDLPPAPAHRPADKADWRMIVDASVTADSNVTNGSDLRTVPIIVGSEILPVPLDPAIRERKGVGVGASLSASGRVPIASGAALAVDAEAYALEYQGARSDDAALLLAAGAELGGGEKARASLQLVAFSRWYGGIVANSGFGVRGRYQNPVGEGRNLSLSFDARRFTSDYGEDFGGTQASAYLSYDAVLAPDLSVSAGGFARREWLGDDAYSSLELGIYGGLSHYLSDDLTGGLSGGISRLSFDAPLLFLSPDARRDWRIHGSLYVTTRRPLGWGLFPSLTYSYNKTGSSIGYYRADHHRLRLGMTRTF